MYVYSCEFCLGGGGRLLKRRKKKKVACMQEKKADSVLEVDTLKMKVPWMGTLSFEEGYSKQN